MQDPDNLSNILFSLFLSLSVCLFGCWLLVKCGSRTAISVLFIDWVNNLACHWLSDRFVRCVGTHSNIDWTIVCLFSCSLWSMVVSTVKLVSAHRTSQHENERENTNKLKRETERKILNNNNINSVLSLQQTHYTREKRQKRKKNELK